VEVATLEVTDDDEDDVVVTWETLLAVLVTGVTEELDDGDDNDELGP